MAHISMVAPEKRPIVDTKTYEVYLMLKPKLSPRMGFRSVSGTVKHQFTAKKATIRNVMLWQQR